MLECSFGIFEESSADRMASSLSSGSIIDDVSQVSNDRSRGSRRRVFLEKVVVSSH